MIWSGKVGKTLKFLCPLSSRLLHHKPKEVSIKVPWGHISGLHWNECASATPIICLHGWKDNAATFNRIIPIILDHSTQYQFLAIDLPGHGLSSHYPPGMMYQLIDHLIAIRRVAAHFGWAEKHGIQLMGHSLGAIISFIFAASHPKMTDGLDDLLYTIRTTTKEFLKTENFIKSGPVTRTFKELRKAILDSHMGISETACDVLMERMVVEVPPGSGKWAFAHDPRVHYLPLMNISPDQTEHFGKSFRSKLLLIKAENGVNYYSDYQEANMLEWLVKDNKKNVKFITVKDTGHHIHLDEPEKILPDILTFLTYSSTN